MDDGAVSLTGTAITLTQANVLGACDGGEWSGRHLADGEVTRLRLQRLPEPTETLL